MNKTNEQNMKSKNKKLNLNNRKKWNSNNR